MPWRLAQGPALASKATGVPSWLPQPLTAITRGERAGREQTLPVQGQQSSALRGLWQLLASAVPSGKDPNPARPQRCCRVKGTPGCGCPSECYLLCLLQEGVRWGGEACIRVAPGEPLRPAARALSRARVAPSLGPHRIPTLALAGLTQWVERGP